MQDDAVLRDYVGYEFDLNQCGDCGFIQPAVVPARAEYFDALYDQKWSEEWMAADFDCTYKDYIFTGILQDLAKLLPPDRRKLLDVGCHVGRMVYLAARCGWKADGVELNPRTAAFAAARTGLTIHRQNAKALAASGSRYDAVLLTDVLEHIPNPVPLLVEMRQLLDCGGVVSVKVPCGASQLLKQSIRHSFDRSEDVGIGTNYVHINHFGPRSLKLALEKAGFTDVTIGIGAPELVPGENLRRTFDRAFRKFVFHAGRLLPLGVRTPLALNLQAYARAP
jgi:SAM-dependent methyltransferase